MLRMWRAPAVVAVLLAVALSHTTVEGYDKEGSRALRQFSSGKKLLSTFWWTSEDSASPPPPSPPPLTDDQSSSPELRQQSSYEPPPPSNPPPSSHPPSPPFPIVPSYYTPDSPPPAQPLSRPPYFPPPSYNQPSRPAPPMCPPCPICASPPFPDNPPPYYSSTPPPPHYSPNAPPPPYYTSPPPYYHTSPPPYGGGPWGPWDPTSPSNPPHGDDLLWDLTTWVDSMGLGFLLNFFSDSYQYAMYIGADLPIAANYFYKLVEHGHAEVLTNPGSYFSRSVSMMIRAGLHFMLQSDTGSIVASWLLDYHNIDVTRLMDIDDLSGMLTVFSTARMNSEVVHTGWEGIASILSNARDLVRTIMREAIRPGGRVSLFSVAFDLTAGVYVLAEQTLVEADFLRDTLNSKVAMTDHEYWAFIRLKDNLSQVRDALLVMAEDLLYKSVDRHTDSPTYDMPAPSQSPPPEQAGSTPPPSYPPPADPDTNTGKALEIAHVLESLGFGYILDFSKELVSAVNGIFQNTLVAANYIYKLVNGGLADAVSGRSNELAEAFLKILKTTFAKMASTNSGSIIAAHWFSSDHILRDLAGTSSLGEVVEVLSSSKVLQNWLGGMNSYGEGVGVSAVYSVAGMVTSLVYNSISPYGRLTPLQLASELTDIASTFVTSVVDQGFELRYSMWVVQPMSEEEWMAFRQLQSSLTSLSITLEILNMGLTDAASTSAHAPPPNHPALPYSPSFEWNELPPSPPLFPSFPSSGAPRVGRTAALETAADKLGVSYLVSFVQAAYTPALGLLEDLPLAANYLYRLISNGQQRSSNELTDPTGPAANSVFKIFRDTLSALSSSDVGSKVLADYLSQYNIDLYALVAAPDLVQALAVLKEATGLQSAAPLSAPQQQQQQQAAFMAGGGPLDVTSGVVNAISAVFYEAYARYGRLEPIGLASDLVDISLTLVNSTVAEADTLRWTADADFRMDDDEYLAFYRMTNNLALLRNAIADVADNLQS